MSLSPPLRLFLRAVLTVALVWVMATYLSGYFSLSGGLGAVIITGSLLTLMNLLVRPLLKVITFPLKLLATLLAIILTNWLFLWITVRIAERMDPALVILQIRGGIGGWLVVAIILGTANWLMKEILR